MNDGASGWRIRRSKARSGPRCQYQPERYRTCSRPPPEPAPPHLVGHRRRRPSDLRRDPFQLVGKVSRRLPAVVRVFGQALSHHAPKRWAESLNVIERGRLRVEHGGHHGSGAAAVERSFADQHFVEDRAKCKDIGSRVNLLAFELLRRHVVQRAENRAFTRHALHALGPGGR